MGLLDDAIREHLELKRRHGADPSEVERQEQEALGPARRGAAAPVADAEVDAGAVSVGMLDEDEERAPAGELYDDEQDDEPPPSMPAGEPEAPIAPPAPAPAPAPAEKPEPASEERFAPREPVADLGEAPEDAEDERPEAAPEAREDVLEETPDFLQETPEHDRLWFEQKPPRDFEF